MQQGDTEDGLKIQLASSPPPSRASKIQIVEPKSVAKFGDKGAKAAAGQWTVQIGAFGSRADARRQLAEIGRKYGQHFDDARGVAEKDGRKFKAQFDGMSEADARDACRALKSRGRPCLVIPPRG
jgi:D-alanyl-D-alanine carboxypeptidase (penicillin-binding protein 5/6)